jgi:Nodulin-like
MMRVKEGSRPPWVGLGAAVWVEIAAGCAYTFPLYSHALKSALGLNQQQLTLLGVANDVGENFGLLPGVLCNRFAPWLILLIGAACSLVGFGVVWLSVSQVVTAMPYWLVSTAISFLPLFNCMLQLFLLFPLMKPVMRGDDLAEENYVMNNLQTFFSPFFI